MIIDFSKLVKILLPTFMRGVNCIAFFDAIAAAFIVLYDDYKKYRTDTLYTIDHTSQQCKLKEVLNDAIDKYDRRIQVEDIESLGFFYIYADNETVDSVIDADTQIYSKTICGVNSVSFQVLIPAMLFTADVINQATAITKKYKTIGRSFIVKSY